jgi:hypothetical protein
MRRFQVRVLTGVQFNLINMRKYIVCRVRNSIDLINQFLDHYADFDGFVFYDDHSDDGTRDILDSHEKVLKVVTDGNDSWSSDSWLKQLQHRKSACDEALNIMNDNDFLFVVDSDEFMDFDHSLIESETALIMRMYHFVMTDQDKSDNITDREWCLKSPQIQMMGCKKSNFSNISHHRTINTKDGYSKSPLGVVRHYGRARGEDRFDQKCDYYVNNTNSHSYKKKWGRRKGGGVYKVEEISKDNQFMNWNQFQSNKHG